MYCAVDTDTMQFTHVHPDYETLAGIAWLECADRSVHLDNTDREFFLWTLTGIQLRKLYKNTTGTDITGTPDIVVREMLATLVEENLPVRAGIDLHHLRAQIEAAEDLLQDGRGYVYNPKSNKPKQGKFKQSLHCTNLDAVTAGQCAVRAKQKRKAVTASTPAAAPANATSGPTAAPKRKSRAPAGSIRPVIWKVADQMWEEAGKPQDKTVVLALRKEMMTVLEKEHNVKRTSSSNELGNWMKDRLAS